MLKPMLGQILVDRRCLHWFMVETIAGGGCNCMTDRLTLIICCMLLCDIYCGI